MCDNEDVCDVKTSGCSKSGCDGIGVLAHPEQALGQQESRALLVGGFGTADAHTSPTVCDVAVCTCLPGGLNQYHTIPYHTIPV